MGRIAAGMGAVLAAAAVGLPFIASATSPLASSCTGCHQPSVNSPEMPALNRLPAARIAASLRAARDAPQTGSIMARFVTKMSDAEIDRLATQLGASAAR